MAMPYLTGFDFNPNEEFDFGDALEIPNDCSFSEGATLQSESKFAYDYTKTSQSITRCKRKQAKTYSVGYELRVADYGNLFTKIGEIDGCVGRVGDLHFCGLNYGLCMITSAAITLNIDACDIVSVASITLNITEAKEPIKPKKAVKRELI
jgi:hypothetical protein